MTSFTKGKWSQSHREGSDGMYNTEVYDDRGHTICILDWHTEPNATRTDRPENAALIAAAPDMYAMVNEVLSMQKQWHGHGMETHMKLAVLAKKMELLLSKARGE